MVLFPSLVGSVEVEERRPRYWNEPRRKRLSFVKSHKPKRPEEWQLAPRSQPQAFPRNEQERWDLQQFQAQQRFMQNEAHRAQLRRQQEWLQYQAQMQRLQGQQRQQLAQHAQHGGIPIPPQHHGAHEAHAHHGSVLGSDSGNDIEEVISSSDSSSDDGHDHDHHAHHSKKKKKKPKMIEMKPQGLPTHFYHPDDKKKDKKKKKKGSHKSRSRSRPRWYEAYDSDSSIDSFVIHSRAHSRGRRPSRARWADDSSDSDRYVYHYPVRVSSKHRKH